jgi:hypothetical protein
MTHLEGYGRRYLQLIKVIRSRRVSLAGNVARTRQTRNPYKVLVGTADKRDRPRYLGLDGKIILEFRKFIRREEFMVLTCPHIRTK